MASSFVWKKGVKKEKPAMKKERAAKKAVIPGYLGRKCFPGRADVMEQLYKVGAPFDDVFRRKMDREKVEVFLFFWQDNHP
jgi:hypothetical protein